jgi:integrase
MAEIFKLPTPVNKVIEKAKDKIKHSGLPFRLKERKISWFVEIRRKGVYVNSSFTFSPTTKQIVKAEAIKWGYTQVERIDNGDLSYVSREEGKGKTLRWLIEEFLKATEPPHGPYIKGSSVIMRKSIDNVRKNIKTFVKRNPNGMLDKMLFGPGRLSVQDFRNYSSYLAINTKSTATIHRYINDLYYVIEAYGVDARGLPIATLRVDQITGRKLKLPPEINKPRRPLEDWEINKIMESLRYIPRRSRLKANPDRLEGLPRNRHKFVYWQWQLLTQLGVQTGVRLNGLLKIRWQDIDWENNRYEQPADKFGPAKKGSPKRTIPISYDMASQLWDYYNAIPEECRKQNHPVFFNTHGKNKGKALNPGAASNYFRLKVVPRAGLVIKEGERTGKANLSFHHLRYTAKINFIQLGLDTDERNYMTGTKIDDRYVAHMPPWRLDAIHDKIDKGWREYSVLKPKLKVISGKFLTDGASKTVKIYNEHGRYMGTSEAYRTTPTRTWIDTVVFDEKKEIWEKKQITDLEQINEFKQDQGNERTDDKE